MSDRHRIHRRLTRFVVGLFTALVTAAPAAASPFTIDPEDPEQWDPANIRFDGLIQTRYRANLSSNNSLEDQFLDDFGVARARVRARWNPSEWVRAEVQLDSNDVRTDIRLLDAVVEFKLADGVFVRAGQHRVHYSREFATSITRQLGMDRTVVDRTLGVLRSEFVNLRLRGDRTQAEFFITDGSRGARATSFNDPDEANFGLTARVEHLLMGDSFRTFRDFSAFRGTERALMAGAGISYDDGDNGDPDILRVTADLSYENNGTNLFGSFYLRHGLNDPDDPTGSRGTDDPTDLGFLVQGGHFITENTELFARYSAVLPDPDRNVDDTFQEITLGSNYFMIPESHAVKVTTELIFYVTDLVDSIVASSDRVGLVPSDSEQFVARVQIQLQF